MIRIAICDDEKVVIDEVTEIISSYCNIRKVEFKVCPFSDGTDLLISSQKFDIIFLDIEMNYSNSIEVAEQIRQQDMNVPIVYITSYNIYKGKQNIQT